VVPRAAHAVAVDQPFGQRPAVVGAGRADREHVGAAARQQHRFAVRMTEQRAPVGEG